MTAIPADDPRRATRKRPPGGRYSHKDKLIAVVAAESYGVTEAARALRIGRGTLKSWTNDEELRPYVVHHPIAEDRLDLLAEVALLEVRVGDAHQALLRRLGQAEVGGGLVGPRLDRLEQPRLGVGEVLAPEGDVAGRALTLLERRGRRSAPRLYAPTEPAASVEE